MFDDFSFFTGSTDPWQPGYFDPPGSTQLEILLDDFQASIDAYREEVLRRAVPEIFDFAENLVQSTDLLTYVNDFNARFPDFAETARDFVAQNPEILPDIEVDFDLALQPFLLADAIAAKNNGVTIAEYYANFVSNDPGTAFANQFGAYDAPGISFDFGSVGTYGAFSDLGGGGGFGNIGLEFSFRSVGDFGFYSSFSGGSDFGYHGSGGGSFLDSDYLDRLIALYT